MGRIAKGATAVALLLATLAGPLAGQERVVPDSAAALPPAPPATGGWAAYAAVPHPWSTVVALTVVVPAGSAGDPEGRSGTALLLGRTTADALRERLGSDGIRVEAEVDRGRTVYHVLTVPDGWLRAYRALEAVLFTDPAATSALEQERSSLLAALDFESGAPVREFEEELYRLLGGASDPWSRDPSGTTESLAAVTGADLEAYRRLHYERGDAVFSVVGAVDSDEVARTVTGQAADGESGPGGAWVAVEEVPPAPPAPAWDEGDHVRLVRDVTSGWIGAAYPVDPSSSRTAVEMVVHRARSELITDPPAPGLFSAEVGLEELPGGQAAVVIRAAVLPDAIQSWETRILDTMARVSGEALEPDFFRFHRRRFRNLRLVEDAPPEVEGLRTALDLQRDGRLRDLSSATWELDTRALAAAASALGPPRVLVFGPDLAGSGGTHRPAPERP